MTCNKRLPALTALIAAVALASCGGGEQAPPPKPDEPLAMAGASPASPADAAPGPPSLPEPAAVAAAPAPRATLPGPPRDGPPLRIGQREDSAVDHPMPGVRWQAVAKGLVEPRDLVASVDGHLFYTERTRGLSLLRPDGSRHLLFAPPDLWSGGQAGMFGVAVDPAFTTTRRLFVFMTVKQGDRAEARVLRLTLDERLQQVVERKDILAGIAMPEPKSERSAGPWHIGGALRFGGGEQLYVGLGDGRSPAGPQSATLLQGKLLRIDREGRPAGGNRLPKGFDARVFAYGFRNPVALAVNPGTTDPMVAESGQGQADRIALAAVGGNAGWDPRCAGAPERYCDAAAPNKGGTALPTPAAIAASGVAYSWRGSQGHEGLHSAAFLSGRFLWTWSGALAVAFGEGRRIDLLKLDHLGQVVRSGTLLRQTDAGFRAIVQVQDTVYVMTGGKAGGDEIWRLAFQ